MSALPQDCEEWLTSRSRIDKAGEAYRSDPTSSAALRHVQCYRLFRLSDLDPAFAVALPPIGEVPVVVAGRLKRLPTIVRKLERYPEMRLSGMADVLGLRIICESLDDGQRLVANFESVASHKRLIDYVATPQETGYRGYHEIVRITQPFPCGKGDLHADIEIQIRTYFQHLWALESESHGEQVKEGGGHPVIRSYLVELSHAIQDWERRHPSVRQHPLPVGSSHEYNLAVVRMIEGGRPNVLQFGTDVAKASAQLVRWEEDIAGGDSESLLLAGRSLSTLAWTHSICFGMTEVPLEDWMPKLSRDLRRRPYEAEEVASAPGAV